MLEIPQSVQNIGEGAFIGCSMIEKLILSDNLESIGRFAGEKGTDEGGSPNPGYRT